MGEIWKAIVGVLISGGPLLAVQLGGRRGLMRRAIREDLELIKLLGDEHAAVRERLRRRVETRLEQYEPGDGAKKRQRRGWTLAVIEFVTLMLAAVVILEALDIDSTWTSSTLGAGLGIIGAVVHAVITSRLDKREQDQAVAEVRLAGTLQPVTASFGVHVEPQQADRGE